MPAAPVCRGTALLVPGSHRRGLWPAVRLSEARTGPLCPAASYERLGDLLGGDPGALCFNGTRVEACLCAGWVVFSLGILGSRPVLLRFLDPILDRLDRWRLDADGRTSHVHEAPEV